MVVAFDTLEYAGRLERAGFTREQAAAQVQALVAIVSDELVTKRDLHELHLAVQRDFDEFHLAVQRDFDATRKEIADLRVATQRDMQDLRHGMRELGHRLTIRLGGMLAVSVGVMAALVKLL